ncbi:hypothetical protein BASA83_009268 [Batrachochytrium salamandrivorans]|nr:hypothetical protein BASA83_009268 [Batrachochytrium salamandrivorans]
MGVDPLNPRAQLGSTIDGARIKLLSILGEGSFAVVFLGQDMVTNVSYAVKCLYKTGLTERQMQLQMREASQLQTLAGHPNVVRLFKTIQTRDCLFLVLERCKTDLFDSIMRHDGFSEPTARRLFSQLVDAVAVSHSKHIYHRDLKPENVLVTYPGEAFVEQALVVKLTDFGLATTDTVSTEFGCGSVRYMAPECLAGDTEWHNAPPSATAGRTVPIAYSPPANDVWSLGIILINLLTGKNPWVEPSSKDKHYQAHILCPASVAVSSFRPATSAASALVTSSLANGSSYTNHDSFYYRQQQRRVARQDSFQVQFGFSDELCVVLRRIFDLDPFRRPTAAELKLLVEAVPQMMQTVKPAMPPTPVTPSSHQVYSKAASRIPPSATTTTTATGATADAARSKAITATPLATAQPNVAAYAIPSSSLLTAPGTQVVVGAASNANGKPAIAVHSSEHGPAPALPKSAPTRPEFLPGGGHHRNTDSNGFLYVPASPQAIATPPSVTAAAAASAANAAARPLFYGSGQPKNSGNRRQRRHRHSRQQHHHHPPPPPPASSRWIGLVQDPTREKNQQQQQHLQSTTPLFDMDMLVADSMTNKVYSHSMHNQSIFSLVGDSNNAMINGAASSASLATDDHTAVSNDIDQDMSSNSSRSSGSSISNGSYNSHVANSKVYRAADKGSTLAPLNTHRTSYSTQDETELWSDESHDLVFDLEPSLYSSNSMSTSFTTAVGATHSAPYYYQSGSSSTTPTNTTHPPLPSSFATHLAGVVASTAATNGNSSIHMGLPGSLSRPSVTSSAQTSYAVPTGIATPAATTTAAAAAADVLGPFAHGISKKAPRRRPGVVVTVPHSSTEPSHNHNPPLSSSTIYSASTVHSATPATAILMSDYHMSAIDPISEEQLSPHPRVDWNSSNMEIDQYHVNGCDAADTECLSHAPLPAVHADSDGGGNHCGLLDDSQSQLSRSFFRSGDDVTTAALLAPGSSTLLTPPCTTTTIAPLSVADKHVSAPTSAHGLSKVTLSPSFNAALATRAPLDSLSSTTIATSTTPVSRKMSEDLKRPGFKSFVLSTGCISTPERIPGMSYYHDMPHPNPQQQQKYTPPHGQSLCAPVVSPLLTPPSDFSLYLADINRTRNSIVSVDGSNSGGALFNTHVSTDADSACVTVPPPTASSKSDILQTALHGLRSILYEMSDTDLHCCPREPPPAVLDATLSSTHV